MTSPSPRTASRFALAALLLAAGAVQGGEEIPRAALDEARKASGELVTSVRGELMKAIEASGPLRAIVVCKYTVPEIASSVSRRYGARVTRVSLTPRNPSLGWGDAWEQKVLMDFDARVERGEKPENLEHAEITVEPSGRFLRYMKALPMSQPCLHCPGPTEQISESIRQQLAHEYPHDRATGVALGKVRGAVTYKKPIAP
ncbi:MAG: DUF3365 domain-containing protein [Burkholderiaceae bacterium]|nr:MAG: DUF3365 domain-containing protein [Burkholderiaceae bacterium]